MNPFTDVPYLKQHLRGRAVAVDPKRHRAAARQGQITPEQPAVRENGAIGSHLENWSANDGVSRASTRRE